MKHRALPLACILALLFSSCGAGLPARWDKPAVLEISGSPRAGEGKKAALFLGEDGSLLTEGLLSDVKGELPVLVCLDTGSPGSYVDRNVLLTLGKARHSRYCFPASIDGGKPSVGIGYVFSSLKLGDISISRPLLSAVDLGRTQKRASGGRKATVILGMNILSQKPFLISMAEKSLCFPEGPPAWAGTALAIEEKDLFTDLKFRLPLKLEDGASALFMVNSGEGLSSCDGETLAHISSPANPGLRTLDEPPYRFTFIKTSRFAFAGQELEEALFTSVSPDRLPNSLGMQILCGYDIYADYRGRSLMVRPAEEFDASALKHLLDKPGSSRLSPTFGFSLGEKGHRRFVHGISYASDGSQLVPEIKRGDEILSIDGIGLQGYDWTKWYKLDEATFVFLRKGEEFTLRLKRRKLGE